MDSTGAVIEAFAELAPRYEETLDAEVRQLWGMGYREFIDQILAIIPFQAGNTVLDVATGTGVIPLQIAKRSSECRIVGLDITPAMLNQAQMGIQAAGLSSTIRMICASGMRMPFTDAVFDIVTCGLGMHHMEGRQLVDEMCRVLRPGGWLVMADVGASPFWRSRLGTWWLKVLMVYFGMTRSRARARAETDALANLRTAEEWRTFLSASEFVGIQITELRCRRRFYPSALLISAQKRTG